MDDADLDLPEGRKFLHEDSLVTPMRPGAHSPLYKRVSMKPWHEALAEYLILNPTATHKQCAEHFDVTPTSIHLLTSSDMFKFFMEQRKKSFRDKVDQTALDRLQGKIATTAEHAIDVLDEKIELERANLGIEAVTETAEMLLRSLGLTGTKGSQTNQVQVNVNVNADDLASARAKMQTTIDQPERKLLPES